MIKVDSVQVLRQIRAEIADLRQKLADAEAVERYMVRRYAVAAVADKLESPTKSHPSNDMRVTWHEAAKDALQSLGARATIATIVRELRRCGYKPDVPNYLFAATLRTAMHRKSQIFYRPTRKTWALTEWLNPLPAPPVPPTTSMDTPHEQETQV